MILMKNPTSRWKAACVAAVFILGRVGQPTRPEVGPVKVRGGGGGGGVSPIGGDGARPPKARLHGHGTDGIPVIQQQNLDQQSESESDDNANENVKDQQSEAEADVKANVKSTLANIFDYFADALSDRDVKTEEALMNVMDHEDSGDVENSNDAISEPSKSMALLDFSKAGTHIGDRRRGSHPGKDADSASLSDIEHTKPFTFVDGMDRLKAVSHRLRSDKNANSASLLIEVRNVAQALLRGLLLVQEHYEKGDVNGAVQHLKSSLGNLAYFFEASRGMKAKRNNKGLDILESSGIDGTHSYNLEEISNARLAEFLQPHIFEEQIEIVRDTVNILESLDLSLLSSQVDKDTTHKNFDSSIASADDERWQDREDSQETFKFESNAFDFGFAGSQTTFSQPRGQFRPQNFFDHSSLHNFLHQHRAAASKQYYAQKLSKISSLFENNQAVMARHELRMNALGDTCQAKCITAQCNCEKLFGCVQRMSAYDLAVLVAGGFVDTTITSQSYANFTVSVDDLSLFDADVNIEQKLAQLKADTADTLANVAQGKPAHQSSTFGGYVASLAVDGNRDTFSCTGNSGDEWWKVDLGQEYAIQTIKLVNRQHPHDNVRDRLRNFDIKLLDSTETQVGLIHQVETFYSEKEFVVKEFESDEIKAQHVKVFMPKGNRDDNWLHFAELEVYADTAAAKCKAVLESLWTGCDPAKVSCSDPNTESFHVSVDHICSAVETKTKLLFEVIGDEFDGFVDEGVIAKKHPLSYDVCLEFVAAFDRLYTARDTNEYTLPNPMRKNKDVVLDGKTWLEIFQHTKFPTGAWFRKDSNTGVVAKNFTGYPDTYYFTISDPKSGKALQSACDAGLLDLLTHDPSDQFQHFSLSDDGALVPRLCSTKAVSVPGSCHDFAVFTLENLSSLGARDKVKVGIGGTISSGKCPGFFLVSAMDAVRKVKDPSKIRVRLEHRKSGKYWTFGSSDGNCDYQVATGGSKQVLLRDLDTMWAPHSDAQVKQSLFQIIKSEEGKFQIRSRGCGGVSIRATCSQNAPVEVSEQINPEKWRIRADGTLSPVGCEKFAVGFDGDATSLSIDLKMVPIFPSNPNQQFTVAAIDPIILPSSEVDHLQSWQFQNVDPGYSYAVTPGFPGEILEQDMLESARDKELAKYAMHSCDASMKFLLGSQMSLGTLRAIVSEVQGGPDRMPGKCCFDTPTTNDAYLGLEFDPADMDCTNPGFWHLGISKEVCNAVGGKWFRSPCITLKSCIDARPKLFDPDTSQAGTCQDVLRSLSVGFVSSNSQHADYTFQQTPSGCYNFCRSLPEDSNQIGMQVISTTTGEGEEKVNCVCMYNNDKVPDKVPDYAARSPPKFSLISNGKALGISHEILDCAADEISIEVQDFVENSPRQQLYLSYEGQLVSVMCPQRVLTAFSNGNLKAMAYGPTRRRRQQWVYDATSGKISNANYQELFISSIVSDVSTLDSYFFSLTNQGSGLMLGVDGVGCANGQKIVLQNEIADSLSQKFKFRDSGQIISMKCPSHAITTPDCTLDTALELQAQAAPNNARWQLVADGKIESLDCPDKFIGTRETSQSEFCNERQVPSVGTEIVLSNSGMQHDFFTWSQKNQRFTDLIGPYYFVNGENRVMGIEEGECTDGMPLNSQAYDPSKLSQQFYIGNFGAIYSAQCEGGAISMEGSCEDENLLKVRIYENDEGMKWDYKSNGVLRSAKCQELVVNVDGDGIRLASPGTGTEESKIWKRENTRLLPAQPGGSLWNQKWTIDFVGKDYDGTSLIGELLGTRDTINTAQDTKCHGPNPAFSATFEEFAKEIAIKNENNEAQCQHARSQLAFDADYPFDADVCDAFNKKLCDIEFTHVDHAMESLSGPPQFESVEHKSVVYKKVEYKKKSFQMQGYEQDKFPEIEDITNGKDWIPAKDEESSEGDNPSKASLNQVQDAWLACQLVQHAAERAYMILVDSNECELIPATLPTPAGAVPNPAHFACNLLKKIGFVIVSTVLVMAQVSAEVLFIAFEKATEGPDGEVYANNASRKTYHNLKNLDDFLKGALTKINDNMKNQHMSMLKHLQDRHLALETHIRTDVIDSQNSLGRGITSAQNFLGEAIVDSRNANDQAIVAARNANSDQHAAISEWLHENLCHIYAALNGTCTEFIGPLHEDQTFTPMVLSWPEGQPNMVNRLERLDEAVAGIENTLTLGMSFKDKGDAKKGLESAEAHSVEGKVDAIEARLGAMQDAMQEAMHGQIDEIKGVINVVNSKIHNAENKMDVMEKRMENMENKMDVMEKHMENMENKMDVMEKHMENMENKMDEMTDLISRVMQQNMKVIKALV